MRFIYFILVLNFCTSCKVFRKSSEDIKYTAFRDSSAKIDTQVDLNRTLEIKSKENLYTLQAQGFKSVTVDRDGNIKAEGENGKLDVTGLNSQLNKKEKVDSTASQKSDTDLSQGEDLEGSKQSSTEAKTSGLSLFWVGAVIGFLALILIKVFCKKFNISFLKKLWSNSK